MCPIARLRPTHILQLSTEMSNYYHIVQNQQQLDMRIGHFSFENFCPVQMHLCIEIFYISFRKKK